MCPGDDKVSIALDGNLRVFLLLGDVGRNQNLFTAGRSTAVERTAIDSERVAVLSDAGPDKHKISRIIDRNRRVGLVVGKIRVDWEFKTDLISIGIVTLSDDLEAVTAGDPVSGPADHEIAVGVHGRRGIKLIERRQRVDQELSANPVTE